MLDDAIKAETTSFNKRVVLKSWSNTGMAGRSESMPDYDLIRERAARWHRNEVKAQSDATAEIARAAASSLLVPSATLPPSKQAYALVEPNTRYTADEIQEAEQAAAELKAQQKEDKEQRSQAKRRQREAEKEAAREEREEAEDFKRQRRQFIEHQRNRKYWRIHCRDCRRIWKNSANWIECEWCEEYTICSVCAAGANSMQEHEDECRVD